MDSALVRKLAYLSGAMLALLITLYVVASLIAGSAFSSLETREIDSNAIRATAAVESIMRSLSSVAADWSTWTDAYEAVIGSNPRFDDDNMQPTALATLRVDVMALVTDDGRVAMAARADETSTPPAGVALPGALTALFASRPSNLLLTQIGQETSGVVLLPEGPLLFAAHTITDSSSTKPAHGILFVGRYLDSDEIAGLAEQTHLDIAAYYGQRLSDVPSSVMAAFASGSPTGTIVGQAGPETIAGFRVVRDLAGRPAFVLRVRMPRTIDQAGRGALLYFALALGLLGTVGFGVLHPVVARQHRETLRWRGAETSLRSSEERYRRLLRDMPDAVFAFDAEGRVAFANPQASILTGRTNEEIIGLRSTDLLGAAASDPDLEGFAPSASDHLYGDIMIATASGTSVPVDLSIASMDTGSTGIAVQWIARDATERRSHEAQLTYLAEYDSLTGLMNRRRFEEELGSALDRSRRGANAGAFLWLDIDAVKDVNDKFGHRAGDEVLVGVAGVLAAESRAGNAVCRLGGDEFGALVYDVDGDGAVTVGERISARIRELEFVFDQQRIHVTISIGVALFPGHGATIEEVMARADMAMYAAKRQDRGRCQVYQPDEAWLVELDSRFEWAESIEHALEEDLFLIYAQPILDLSSREVRSYELLIRMRGVGGSIIQPGAFLPVAERVGLIHRIDRWMVCQTIGLLETYRTVDNLRFDVNLSGKVLTDSGMLPLITEELERTGVDPSRLGFEITETAAISDMSKAYEFIDSLRKIGCSVTLDDFGSGFASFFYLSNLPIDGLKIDGGFIKNLTSSSRDQHTVRAMVELSRGHGITSTAEWVEDAETLELLAGYGVTYGQGFWIGRPVPVREVLDGCAGSGSEPVE